MALIWPNGSTSIPRVTSEYGYRTHPITRLKRLHKGIDLAGFELVRSPVAGVVATSGYQPTGAGHYVNVRSTTGDLYKFFHLKKGTKVPVGTRVQPGSVLGVMGKTGAVTGVHLHFEVWPGGRAPINPRTFYARHQSAPALPKPTKPPTIPTPQEDDMRNFIIKAKIAGTFHYIVGNLSSKTGVLLDTAADGMGATKEAAWIKAFDAPSVLEVGEKSFNAFKAKVGL